MSIAVAEPVAAKLVGARTAVAGGSKAAAAKGAAAKGLPRDPGAHVAKLRGQGMDNQQIRKALRDMGYDGATAANVSPGVDRPATTATPEPSAAAEPLITTHSPAAADASTTTTASGPSLPERVRDRIPSGGSTSGLVLGLVLYPVALAFLRDGVPGIKAWFNAKFLNRVSAGPATAGASGQPGTGGGAGAGAGGGGGSSW